MRHRIDVYSFLIFTIICLKTFAQQKLNYMKHVDGTETYLLTSKTDTFFIVNDSRGKKEVECKTRNGHLHGTYKRWYENGSFMWIKKMDHGKANGIAQYFNEKGEKIAELNYAQNIVVDTIYLKSNIHLILGKINFNSKIYGGMEREDGRSNISENSGPMINYSMFVAQLDTIKAIKKLGKFKTDMFGEFIILVPEGIIGLYPNKVTIESIKPPFNGIPGELGKNGSENWNGNLPLNIPKKASLHQLVLEHNSVGYAP